MKPDVQLMWGLSEFRYIVERNSACFDNFLPIENVMAINLFHLLLFLKHAAFLSLVRTKQRECR